MRRLFALLITVLLLGVFLPLAPGARADTVDYDIPNGHFYTQAVAPGTPAGYGYAITDEGTDERGQTILFWTAFKNLGGVSVLGYPSSDRFMLDGFWTQATQKVLMQWRPELKAVLFVNVFDKLHDLGLDPQLQAKYRIPLQVNVNDTGKPFSQVVTERQAWLDANPFIKQAYFSSVNPLQLNGLPTSAVTDVDGVFDIIRAQRVVIQYWKKAIPGVSYVGQITLGLGGDIAKEFGLVPVAVGTPKPWPPVSTTPPTVQPPAPQFPFGQDGATRWIQNCGLTEIRGYIRDENGNGLANQAVKVGVRNGDWSTVSFLTGPDGQYNVFLDNKPKAGSWYVFVIGPNELHLSPTINVDTSGSCNAGDANTVYVDFKRGAPTP